MAAHSASSPTDGGALKVGHGSRTPHTFMAMANPLAMLNETSAPVTPRAMPVTMCPSNKSSIELMSGTPGTRSRTLAARAIVGWLPKPSRTPRLASEPATAAVANTTSNWLKWRKVRV